jgi:hypothetical protein
VTIEEGTIIETNNTTTALSTMSRIVEQLIAALLNVGAGE